MLRRSAFHLSCQPSKTGKVNSYFVRKLKTVCSHGLCTETEDWNSYVLLNGLISRRFFLHRSSKTVSPWAWIMCHGFTGQPNKVIKHWFSSVNKSICGCRCQEWRARPIQLIKRYPARFYWDCEACKIKLTKMIWKARIIWNKIKRRWYR